MIETDDQLAQKSRHGDRAAFEELVRRIGWAVFARLYLETADSHKAEDLAQDTDRNRLVPAFAVDDIGVARLENRPPRPPPPNRWRVILPPSSI